MFLMCAFVFIALCLTISLGLFIAGFKIRRDNKRFDEEYPQFQKYQGR